jgi:hypothetical protein
MLLIDLLQSSTNKSTRRGAKGQAHPAQTPAQSSGFFEKKEAAKKSRDEDDDDVPEVSAYAFVSIIC